MNTGFLMRKILFDKKKTLVKCELVTISKEENLNFSQLSHTVSPSEVPAFVNLLGFNCLANTDTVAGQTVSLLYSLTEFTS